MNRILAGAIVTLLAASTAQAAVTHVSANRTVSSTAIGGTSQSFPSAALGLYNQVATSSFVGSSPFPPPPQSSGSADQTSDTLLTQIPYNMFTTFTDGVSGGAGSGGGESRSTLVVRFSVDVATPYAILGGDAATFSNAVSGAAFVSERLDRIDVPGIIFDQSKGSAGGSLANLSGSLAPGTYEFSVSLLAQAGGNGTAVATASVLRRLDLPAPGAASVFALAGLAAMRRRRN
jgi:hypothetical protein